MGFGGLRLLAGEHPLTDPLTNPAAAATFGRTEVVTIKYQDSTDYILNASKSNFKAGCE